MIGPIRCMRCGFILGDKWLYYYRRVAQLREEKGLANEPITIDGTDLPDKTPERQACDEIGITRYCCRIHMLTHRDLIEKI